jgi:hypothetical protein
LNKFIPVLLLVVIGYVGFSHYQMMKRMDAQELSLQQFGGTVLSLQNHIEGLVAVGEMAPALQQTGADGKRVAVKTVLSERPYCTVNDGDYEILWFRGDRVSFWTISAVEVEKFSRGQSPSAAGAFKMGMRSLVVDVQRDGVQQKLRLNLSSISESGAVQEIEVQGVFFSLNCPASIKTKF